MTDIARIEAASFRLAGHALRTPLLNSPFLDDIAGRRVWVKAECLQVTGSFKARGAAVGVSRAKELGVRALAMPTNGNAGAAWAIYCARPVSAPIL